MIDGSSPHQTKPGLRKRLQPRPPDFATAYCPCHPAAIYKPTSLLADEIIKKDRTREAEIAFSPDGRMAAVSHDNSAEGMTGIQLIDTNTGRMLHNFEGEAGGFTSAKFSRDGKRLAAGTWMGTILIYEVPEKLLKR
jgi:dipeptidyl aminopeptidase/acylaminoacyl peptidase